MVCVVSEDVKLLCIIISFENSPKVTIAKLFIWIFFVKNRYAAIGEIALCGGGWSGIKIIHPRSSLGKSVWMAAEVYEGVCTDLPPPRKR